MVNKKPWMGSAALLLIRQQQHTWTHTPLTPPKSWRNILGHDGDLWTQSVYLLLYQECFNMTEDNKDINNWYNIFFLVNDLLLLKNKKKMQPVAGSAIIKCISEIGWSFMRTLSCYRLINQKVIIQNDVLMWVWFQITNDINAVSDCTLQHKVTLRIHPCWDVELVLLHSCTLPGLLQNNESLLNTDQTAFRLRVSDCISAKVWQTVTVRDK